VEPRDRVQQVREAPEQKLARDRVLCRVVGECDHRQGLDDAEVLNEPRDHRRAQDVERRQLIVKEDSLASKQLVVPAEGQEPLHEEARRHMYDVQIVPRRQELPLARFVRDSVRLVRPAPRLEIRLELRELADPRLQLTVTNG